MDLKIIEKINSYTLAENVPISELKPGDKTSDPHRIGVTHLHQFYTKRISIIFR